MSKTVVGLFNSVAQAQQVKQQLISNGYTADDIRVVANEQSTPNASGYTSSSASGEHQETGVIASIKHFFSSFTDSSESDQEYYSQGVSRGGALLAATVPDNRADATLDLLEQYGATNVEEEASTAVAGAGSSGSAARTQTSTGATGDVAIPIVEEELQVGKRQVNRGGVRVYSQVISTPVEENVQLREERVRIDRNQVNRPATEADFQAFKEGQIELTETAEEAVVSKQARVVEEVIVGKEVNERTQTVRDSVRHTEVEVEEVTPEIAKKSTTSGR